MIRNVRHSQILGGVSFPPEVLNAIAENRLVIFAGAGVSRGDPSDLPDFWELVTDLAIGSGKNPSVPLDQFLGTLPNQDNLRQRAAGLTDTGSPHNALHESIIRTFGELSRIRVVTTNYDKMFELAALALYAETPTTFSAPALPVGENFNGIVHVHGFVEHPNGIVLTDSHFGEAYLSEGWARRFLLSMFQSDYTVLFVGYSHDDTMLRYLARALPVGSNTLRYTLVSSNEPADKWVSLGISTLKYDSDEKHTVLYSAVEALANYAHRRPSEWKYQLEQLASQPPTGSPADENLVRSVLSSASHFRFFIGAEVHEDWYQWLIDNNGFQTLYEQDNPDEVSLEISDWLSQKVLKKIPHTLILVLASLPKPIKQWFWRQLAIRSSDIKDNPLFLRLVDRLLQQRPEQPDWIQLRKLTLRLAEIPAIPQLLTVFEILIGHEVSLEIRQYRPSEESVISPIRARITENTNSHALREVYDVVKPFQSSDAETILNIVERALLARQVSLNTWDDMAWAGGDLDSFSVDTIDLVDQIDDPEFIDVLVNIARDSLEHLGEHEPAIALSWLKKRLTSESSVTRRLAVHAISHVEELDANQKIKILLDRGLHDRSYKHEAHVLLRKHYGCANDEVQNNVIVSIKAYLSELAETAGSNQLPASEQVQFDWLNELADANQKCTKLQSAIADLRKQNPDMKASEYTAPSTRIRFSCISHSSPYSTDDLLGKDGISFDDILSFKSDTFRSAEDPSMSGLENAVSQAAKLNSTWAFSFIDHLCSKQLWGNNFFPYLLRELGIWPEKEAEAQRLLDLISNPKVQSHHPREITDIVLNLVRGEGVEYFCNIVEKTDKVAKTIFDSVQTSDEASIGNNANALSASVNSVSGRLTEYWIHALSHRINRCGSTGLDAISKEQLQGLSDPKSKTSALTIPVLTQQLGFLNAVDAGWAQVHLIPLFLSTDDNINQLSWSGYLYSKGPTQDLFPLLEPAFEYAFQHIDHLFFGEKKSRLLEFLAAAVVWIIDKPQDVWLPRIIKAVDDADRKTFVDHLGRMIKNLDADERAKAWKEWLKPYWENRISGAPAPIGTHEFNALLQWLPHLGSQYPEAVELLNLSPASAELTGYCALLFYDRKGLIESHPTATATLLSGLLARTYPTHFFSELDDQILEPLREQRTDISPEILEALNQILINEGFDVV